MKNIVSGSIAAFMLLAASSGLCADKATPLQLSVEHAKCRSFVLPNLGEQSYRNIPWRASVLHGIVDAQKNDKPIMFVLMNGHPLGCT